MSELLLKRKYYPNGTNGSFYLSGQQICYTIELPWRNNQTGISCIPEGNYLLSLRKSEKHGEHLLVSPVPGRSLILIHPANIALKELRGCIAPVTTLSGAGCGKQSRSAMQELMRRLKPYFATIGTLILNISAEQDPYLEQSSASLLKIN